MPQYKRSTAFQGCGCKKTTSWIHVSVKYAYISNTKSNITHDERKVIIRAAKRGQVAAIVVDRLGFKSEGFIQLKYRRATGKASAFLAFVERALCGCSYKEILCDIGNMSMAGISRLCSEGFRMFMENKEYRELFDDIM